MPFALALALSFINCSAVSSTPRPKIEKRLAGIDRASLVSVTDAKAAMREASHAAWIEQQHAKRASERPATGIETGNPPRMK